MINVRDYVRIIMVESLLRNPNFSDIHDALVHIPFWQVSHIKYYTKHSVNDLPKLCDEENLCESSKCEHRICSEELFLVAPPQYRHYKIGLMSSFMFGGYSPSVEWAEWYKNELMIQMALEKVPYLQIPSAMVRNIKYDKEEEKDYLARSLRCIICHDNGKYIKLKRHKSNKIYCPNKKHTFRINLNDGYVDCSRDNKKYQLNTSSKRLSVYDSGKGCYVDLGPMSVMDMDAIRKKEILIPFL